MTPTPEQIERLKTQFERNHWDIKHRVDGKPMSKEESDVIFAALTAAAGVDDKTKIWLAEKLGDMALEVGRLKVEIDATIERCAQVADKLRASVEAKGGENFGVISEALIEAAAAIRALKGKP